MDIIEHFSNNIHYKHYQCIDEDWIRHEYFGSEQREKSDETDSNADRLNREWINHHSFKAKKTGRSCRSVTLELFYKSFGR